MAEKKKRKNSPDVVVRATNKYARAHYDKFLIMIPAGKKEELKAFALKSGAKSLNAWITELMERESGIELVLRGEFPNKSTSKEDEPAE